MAVNNIKQKRRQRTRKWLSVVGTGAAALAATYSLNHAAGYTTTSKPLHLVVGDVPFPGASLVDSPVFAGVSSDSTTATMMLESRTQQSSSSSSTTKKNTNVGVDDDFIVIRRTTAPMNDDHDENLDNTSTSKSSSETASSTSTEELRRELPPVLQQITDERKNFQMNLGKAMDTLRKDYPYILKKMPDFSIYHPDITVVDPSGVQLTGLDSYKSSIKFMQQFIKFWFQIDKSGLQFRLVYDFARSSIRVSWHAVLIPKVPLGKPLHLDGICMYKLDAESGKIVEHKFEKLLINNTPVVPPYGVFSLLQQQDLMGITPGVGVPMGI